MDYEFMDLWDAWTDGYLSIRNNDEKKSISGY